MESGFSSQAMTSGAIQYGVPIKVFLRPTVLSNWALTPKSTESDIKKREIRDRKGSETGSALVMHTIKTNIPSLTSAFSVSRTFWPLMSLWITLWAWRWDRPCSYKNKTKKKKDQYVTSSAAHTLVAKTASVCVCVCVSLAKCGLVDTCSDKH